MARPQAPTIKWQVAGTTTPEYPINGNQVVGFITGGTLVSTAMTFSMSSTQGGTYVPVKDSSGAAVSFTVAPSGYYGFSADQIAKFDGIDFIKFVGGSSEAVGTTIQLVIVPRSY
jgi:hypothetical protein